MSDSDSTMNFNFNKEGTGHCNGHCSICGSLGVTMNTCPLNLYSRNPQPKKHPYAGKTNGRLLNGSDFLNRIKDIDSEEERYSDFPGSDMLDDWFETNNEVCTLISMYRDVMNENKKKHHVMIGFITNCYSDELSTSIMVKIPLLYLNQQHKYYLIDLMDRIVECFEIDPTCDIKQDGISIMYAKQFATNDNMMT